jgi:hypothetical protein
VSPLLQRSRRVRQAARGLAKEVGGLDKLVATANDIGIAKVREFLDVLNGGERITDPAAELHSLINEFKTSERIERVFELARDAAHANKISLKTILLLPAVAALRAALATP